MRVFLVVQSAATRTVLRRRLAHLGPSLTVVEASLELAHTAVRAGSADLVILYAPDGRPPLRALAQLRMADPSVLIAIASWDRDESPAWADFVALPSPFAPERLLELLERASALRGPAYDEPEMSLPA